MTTKTKATAYRTADMGLAEGWVIGADDDATKVGSGRNLDEAIMDLAYKHDENGEWEFDVKVLE